LGGPGGIGVEGGGVEEGGGEFLFTGNVSEFWVGNMAVRNGIRRGRYPKVMRADASEVVMRLFIYIRRGDVEIISVV
jgi:hypothetical protein